jgi:amino acid transporter
MLGFCAGVALTGPRYLEPLASDGYLPQVIAQHHGRFGTPYLAIALTTLITLVLQLFLDFRQLVDLSVLFVGLQYLSTAAALPFLRKREHVAKTFQLPLGPSIPIAGIIVVITFVVIPAGRAATVRQVVVFCALIATGAIPALVWRGIERRRRSR